MAGHFRIARDPGGTEGGFGESGGVAEGGVGEACGDEQGLDFRGWLVAGWRGVIDAALAPMG